MGVEYGANISSHNVMPGMASPNGVKNGRNHIQNGTTIY